MPHRLPLRILLACLALVPTILHAQLEPASTGGAIALQHELRMLGHNRRVLIIGAHPDDEDTELLTLLVRGMGAEAAYLSLNRGEGGQNLIGPELGEALGILRTEELLAARRLDGAHQFFTRAYDFGFSKTLEDTWSHWPRDSVLKDVVRIVRRFQPQIIVAIFSGTPRDGHGHHQASGWAAREAFRVAGDAARFPELAREEGLAPWTPQKLYRSARFDTAATTLVLEGGGLDAAVGQSYHQIAMAGRSLHRSQDMGQLQRVGPSAIRVGLVEDRTGAGGGGFFDGVDTTLASTPPERDASPARRDQERHRARADAIGRGVLLDVVSDDDRIVAGQRVTVTALVANGGGAALDLVGPPEVTLPAGWSRAGGQRAQCASRCELAPGRVDTVVVGASVPADAALSTPYYLAQPRIGDLYAWPASARSDWGMPFERPLVGASVRLAGASADVEREAAFRFRDQARGEVRRPLTVVPRIDVRIDRDTLLVATGAARTVRFVATLTHGARDTTAGRVSLEVPAGWTPIEPREFVLTRQEQRETFDFALRIPATLTPGTYQVRAVATTRAGERYDVGMHVVDYPHIRPRAYARSSIATLVAAPLAMPRVGRIGYVRGAADRVPEALLAVGVPLVLLDSTALERGDLAQYAAIVIGPRAYETDPALVEHNSRVLEYTRRGGLVIVQYQQYQFVEGAFAPYPLAIASPHDRVTDERTPVRVVRPGDPAVAGPNAITPRDWDGWIQERGLYFARSWAPQYRTVLEMHDAGEGPLEGGLLVAPLGRGTYVYSGIAFFRQLPAGVPGAFRLFANLLALPRGMMP